MCQRDFSLSFGHCRYLSFSLQKVSLRNVKVNKKFCVKLIGAVYEEKREREGERETAAAVSHHSRRRLLCLLTKGCCIHPPVLCQKCGETIVANPTYLFGMRALQGPGRKTRVELSQCPSFRTWGSGTQVRRIKMTLKTHDKQLMMHNQGGRVNIINKKP